MNTLPAEIQTRIRAVGADNRSGSIHVTRLAASAMLHLAHTLETMPLDQARALLVQTAVALVKAQPNMAPLFNMSNAVLTEGERAVTPRDLAESVRQAVRNFLFRLQENVRAIVEHILPLLPCACTVLTHSYSGTVREVLLAAKRGRKLKRVICTESRPVCEGVELARLLGEAHIPVTLVVDAASFLYLPHVDLVLVGADTVTTQGVVNKIGTALLALGARHVGVPCYTVCGSEKLLPASVPAPPQPQRNPAEVLAHPPPSVTVENFYFDETPLKLFTAVVTERGVHTPEEVARRLHARPVHPALVRAIAPDSRPSARIPDHSAGASH